MEDIKKAFDALLPICVTHKTLAKVLGYSDKQYWNLRKKIENGERLPMRFLMEFTLTMSRLRGTLQNRQTTRRTCPDAANGSRKIRISELG